MPSPSRRWRLRAIPCLLLLAVGCGGEEARPSSGCAVNSDCHEPLICAFGRCHSQCKADRDCLPGQQCLASGQVGVCQMADEAQCGPAQPCRDPLVCGPQGRCLARCSTAAPCLADQTCLDGVCQAAATDAGAADALAPSPDAPAPSPDAPASPDTGAPPDLAVDFPATTADSGATSRVLDDFDRADGPLNAPGASRWLGDDHGGLATYVVAGGRLAGTVETRTPIWWATPFGGDATAVEAFITIKSLSQDVTDFSLLLASQTFSFCDFIRVLYLTSSGKLQLVSCQDGIGTIHAEISVGLLDGQRLAARFDTDSGLLTVRVADKEVGRATIEPARWRYLHRAGRIGLWLHRNDTGTSGPDLFDDFGGG